MTQSPEARSTNAHQFPLKDELRSTWLELVELAENAHDLTLFALMLLEEVGIASGFLRRATPSHSDASKLDPRNPEPHARKRKAWREMEGQWLSRLHNARESHRVREVFFELLEVYLRAKSETERA